MWQAQNFLEHQASGKQNAGMTLCRRCSRSLLLFATALLVFSQQHALGCACCADDGEYQLIADAPISEPQRAQLAEMKFADAARLYLTNAGEDTLKGISSVTEENTVSVSIEPREWRLTFRSADGGMGTLKLAAPTRITTFVADLHERENAPLGPILYKEWRCQGMAKGDGIFQKGFTAPARYTLVFQGRGNRCDNAGDFKHWRLEISGAKARYAFFGKLLNE